MELRQLRYFAVAADLLNITRAAESLRVAQPAVSRQIRSLEDELGVTLLDRDSRRVKLTAAGSVFLADVKDILEQLEAAESRIKRFSREAVPTLTIGYGPSLAGDLAPEFVRRLRNLKTPFRVELLDLANEEMIAGVRDQKLDAAFLPQFGVPQSEFFTTLPLRAMALDVALPADHPLTKLPKLNIGDLAHAPLIAYDRRQYPDYWMLLQSLFTSARRPLIVHAEVDSGTSLLVAVQSGQGVGIVSSLMHQTRPAGIEFRPLDVALVNHHLCLLHHRDLDVRTTKILHTESQKVFGI